MHASRQNAPKLAGDDNISLLLFLGYFSPIFSLYDARFGLGKPAQGLHLTAARGQNHPVGGSAVIV